MFRLSKAIYYFQPTQESGSMHELFLIFLIIDKTALKNAKIQSSLLNSSEIKLSLLETQFSPVNAGRKITLFT